MPTYNQHKNEIDGLMDVAMTVKAEEKIAATLVHGLRGQVQSLRDYSDALSHALRRLTVFYRDASHPLLQTRESGRTLTLVLTGDKGLVGGLWHTLVSSAAEQKDDQTLLVLGSKGQQYMAEEGIAFEPLTTEGDAAFEAAIAALTQDVLRRYESSDIRAVEVVYPSFVSLLQQEPVRRTVLPFSLASFSSVSAASPVSALRPSSDGANDESEDGLPIFEQPPAALFSAFVRRYTHVFMRQVLLETRLSEAAARAVTTEHVGAKTERLVHKRTMHYIRQRRQSLTRQQLESFAVHSML